MGGIIAVPVDSATGEISFTIRFSLPIAQSEKQAAALKISLAPFFPRTLRPVALNFAQWLSNDRLRMTWEGLSPKDADEAHYYRLLIPGNKGGITDGAGGYFREDLYIFLEAIN
jgi:hypothetical protein